MATILQQKALPGPRSLNPLRDTLAFRQHPIPFLTELQRKYGNIAQFRLGIWPTVFIGHPDYIKYVLQDNYRNYDKDTFLFRIGKLVIGNGLVTVVGGNEWLRQRRLAQPAFHRQRIAALGAVMTDATNIMLQEWKDYAREKRIFDIVEEMSSLTLKIVSKSLFNIDVSPKNNSFRQAFSQVSAILIDHASMPFPPLSVPTPRNRRFWSAVATMDTLTYEIIHDRQKQETDIGDFLSILLDVVDEDGQKMDEKLLRDEIITVLLAGHETSGNALAWTWYFLAQYPKVQERLHAEVDQVLAGRTPTVEDLPRLLYTRMVLEESMRLYPPVWILTRRAIQDDEIAGYHIPANTPMLWSAYLSHRHPDFWEKPEQFYPEHFSPELSAKRPRHAYIPFGIGPRVCLGNNFAMTEMQLIIASTVQQYRVSLAPDYQVEQESFLTLRPKNGVLVSIEPRL
jgi:cytochrome P450